MTQEQKHDRAWAEFFGNMTDAENGRLRRELEALRPQWTKVPPTKPGGYWVYHDVAGLELVQIYEEGGVPRLIRGGEGHALSDVAKYFTYWAGPIEAPPLPDAGKSP